jgi:hypothetical protein
MPNSYCSVSVPVPVMSSVLTVGLIAVPLMDSCPSRVAARRDQQ